MKRIIVLTLGLLLVLLLLAACQDNKDAQPDRSTPSLDSIEWQRPTVPITAENAQDLRLTGVLQGHGGTVFMMFFNENGQRLATLGGDESFRVWNIASGRSILSQTDFRAVSAHFLPDDDTVLTLDRLDQVTRWSMVTQEQLTDTTAHSQRGTASALSPDNTTLAVGGLSGGVSILDTTTLGITREFAAYPPDYVIDALYYSPDGHILYTVNLDLGVLAWDTQTWNTLRQVTPVDTPLLKTVVSPDGTQMAIAIEERILIYDTITGEERMTFAIAPIGFIKTMAFSNDLRWLAIGGNIDSVMIFNTQTGELLVALRGHALNFADLAFSPDSDLIATGLIGGTAYLWNLSNVPETEGSEVQIPRAELRQIPNLRLQTLLWSPDSTSIMLADWSGVIYMVSVPED